MVTLKITMEADYAIRIVYFLTRVTGRSDAKTISEAMSVTLRFALKILRKLCINGIIKSFKGVNGGYQLNMLPEDINLCMVIETINGPIGINRCLNPENICSRVDNKLKCPFHNEFNHINDMLKAELEKINFGTFSGDMPN